MQEVVSHHKQHLFSRGCVRNLALHGLSADNPRKGWQGTHFVCSARLGQDYGRPRLRSGVSQRLPDSLVVVHDERGLSCSVCAYRFTFWSCYRRTYRLVVLFLTSRGSMPYFKPCRERHCPERAAAYVIPYRRTTASLVALFSSSSDTNKDREESPSVRTRKSWSARRHWPHLLTALKVRVSRLRSPAVAECRSHLRPVRARELARFVPL